MFRQTILFLTTVLSLSSAMAGGSQYDSDSIVYDTVTTTGQFIGDWGGGSCAYNTRTFERLSAENRSNTFSKIRNQKNELQVKCSAVSIKKVSSHCYTYSSSPDRKDEYSHTSAIRCIPRPLEEQSLMSLSIYCADHPSEECFKNMQNPEFTKKLNAIRPTQFNVD